MRKKIIFICFLVLTLLWTGFVFSNSFDDGIKSGKKSAAATETVNEIIHTLGSETQIPEKKVRTLAHFYEFAVLGALISADLTLSPLYQKLRKRMRFALPLISIPICFLIACVDECIQKFSAERTMQFSDICMDTLGATLTSVIFALVLFVILCVRSRTK